MKWSHVLLNLLQLCRQQALFHVLGAYSMYNTEVGYCQGMSQIAAILLMYLNEEVSSHCLCTYTVANLEGGRAGSSPSLGDGLTPSFTIMLANAKF